MSSAAINPAPGEEIRRLRERRGLRPVDIQRISEGIRIRKDCADFGISHTTLNDIETGHSIPGARRMFSLAVCLQVPLEQILALYGVDPAEVAEYAPDTAAEIPVETSTLISDFVLAFDTAFDARRTSPLASDSRQWSALPEPLRARMNPSKYNYAWIGTEDDSMADLIPGGSLVEVDRNQTNVELASWVSMRDRPIYFSWSKDGYTCSWCEEDGKDLVILPHPASHTPARRYRTPREAYIIGRVTYAWVPFVGSVPP